MNHIPVSFVIGTFTTGGVLKMTLKSFFMFFSKRSEIKENYNL
jgi:hypothetical protein